MISVAFYKVLLLGYFQFLQKMVVNTEPWLSLSFYSHNQSFATLGKSETAETQHLFLTLAFRRGAIMFEHDVLIVTMTSKCT